MDRDLNDELDPANAVKLFEAIEYGNDDELGSRVLLKCYSQQYNYMKDVSAFSAPY